MGVGVAAEAVVIASELVTTVRTAVAAAAAAAAAAAVTEVAEATAAAVTEEAVVAVPPCRHTVEAGYVILTILHGKPVVRAAMMGQVTLQSLPKGE